MSSSKCLRLASLVFAAGALMASKPLPSSAHLFYQLEQQMSVRNDGTAAVDFYNTRHGGFVSKAGFFAGNFTVLLSGAGGFDFNDQVAMVTVDSSGLVGETLFYTSGGAGQVGISDDPAIHDAGDDNGVDAAGDDNGDDGPNHT